MNSYDRDNNTPVGRSCSYASLGTYNNGSQGMNPPAPIGGVTGSYIVPAYDAPGYNALTMSGQSCSGYATIGPAYNSNGGDCNQQYVRKLCQ